MIWFVRCVMVLCVVSGAVAVADEPVDRVYVNGGFLEGTVVETSVNGVSVDEDDGGVRVVAWFNLREGEGGWEVPDEFVEVARLSSVGHARRARGDLRGCAEMYAQLADGLVGSGSMMAAEVFGGLLEEALVRGDFLDAAVAMIALESTAMSDRAGFDGRYRVHEGVALLPWEGTHRLNHLIPVVGSQSVSDGLILRAFEVVNGLRDGADIAGLVEEMEAQGRNDRVSRQKLELYRQMLVAQKHPEPDARAAAREWLVARSRLQPGGWVDAWCRLGVGVSYLIEGEGMTSRGIVELVHVMVRLKTERPLLARWALDIAADALRSQGRIQEAAELLRSFDTMHTDAREDIE